MHLNNGLPPHGGPPAKSTFDPLTLRGWFVFRTKPQEPTPGTQILTENIRNVSLSNRLVWIECTTTGADEEKQVSGALMIPAEQ